VKRSERVEGPAPNGAPCSCANLMQSRWPRSAAYLMVRTSDLQGLVGVALYVIQRTLSPHFFCKMTPFYVASNVWEVLERYASLSVYEEAPGFRLGPRVCKFIPTGSRPRGASAGTPAAPPP